MEDGTYLNSFAILLSHHFEAKHISKLVQVVYELIKKLIKNPSFYAERPKSGI